MSDVVITGASGMLGRALMQEFATQAPVGTAFSRARGGLARLDLLDTHAVESFFHEHRPKIIVHAAAERRPDISQREPDRTAALNVETTRVLGRVAREIGAFVLYISTDYVFDGIAPPYRPQDQTNPLNLYGRTKREGELALRGELPQAAAILRVGVLFGEVENADESAVTTLVKDVRAGRQAAIDDWGRRYPTYVPDTAYLCRQIAESRLAGTWHWCGDEPYTKYAQAILIGEILHLPTGHLRPDPDPPQGAPRPRDCRLDCSGLEGLGLGRRTPFKDALATSLRRSGL